uniref:Uncharacterized protein n=1 Tax=Glossina brevipalpis TaxID=37001 RepID=A0A1A9WPY6_9MUSC
MISTACGTVSSLYINARIHAYTGTRKSLVQTDPKEQAEIKLSLDRKACSVAIYDDDDDDDSSRKPTFDTIFTTTTTTTTKKKKKNNKKNRWKSQPKRRKLSQNAIQSTSIQTHVRHWCQVAFYARHDTSNWSVYNQEQKENFYNHYLKSLYKSSENISIIGSASANSSAEFYAHQNMCTWLQTYIYDASSTLQIQTKVSKVDGRSKFCLYFYYFDLVFLAVNVCGIFCQSPADKLTYTWIQIFNNFLFTDVVVLVVVAAVAATIMPSA